MFTRPCRLYRRSGCRSCCRCSCSAQNGPAWSANVVIIDNLSNLFGIRNFASRVYLLFFALRSPRPGLVLPSSRPRKSRVPFRPGNAGLFGAYYGMLEDQACIHRRGTSVAPDKLACGPRSRAGHVWVARRENSAHQNSALDALPRMSCLVAQYRSRPERSSSDCLIASVAMCVC